MEQTLIIFKPDAFAKCKVGATIDRFEQVGMRIVAARMLRLDDALLRAHYAHIADKPFFPEVVEFMSSAPVMVIVLAGAGVVERVRNLVGPTDARKAPAGTIRGDWGADVMRNIVHASDSVAAAQAEIARFFRPEECVAAAN